MEHVLAVRTPEELARWARRDDVPGGAPEGQLSPAADAHWILVGRGDRVRARCALWWHGVPSLPGHRLGVIGRYAAADARAGRRLLQHACRDLASRRCTVAVGPMDGNTWRRYRFVTSRGGEPPFFLEPDNPEEWPSHFLQTGFTPLACYGSAVVSELDSEDPRTEWLAARLASQGVRIRPLDPRDMEAELRGIYGIARRSFEGSFLYAPIAEEEFLDQYRPLLPLVRPEVVLVAENPDGPIGFLFALPDYCQAARDQPIDTLILKTVAVLPERATAGLGGLLVARAHQIARSLGYRRAIHALMHEHNVSRNISRGRARTFRRYTLFGKVLEATP